MKDVLFGHDACLQNAQFDRLCRDSTASISQIQGTVMIWIQQNFQ